MELRTGTPEEAAMDPERVERIRKLAEGWVTDGVHHALVVLVARKGVIALLEAFGHLTPAPGSPPLRPDSIFAVMSMTKPVTAAAVMALVEDGLVGLMRPVRDYFPEITTPGSEEVLIHHLLSHTSGWTDFDVETEIARRGQEEGDAPPPEPGQHPDIAAYLHLACGSALACRPGEAMQYCQFNYELLADLVRRVSGTPIEVFARERIFEPLGMCDSTYVLPPEHRERKVRRDEGMPGSAFFSRFSFGMDTERFEGLPRGAIGLHTTAPDLAIFAQMLLNRGTYAGRRILSRASVEAMMRNQVPPGAPVRWQRLGPDGERIEMEFSGGYGYGLFPFFNSVAPYLNGGLASPSSFGHMGFGGTHFWADPERELIGVYLSVARRNLGDEATPDWRADLFADAGTAAVGG